MDQQSAAQPTLDSLVPPDMARESETVGVAKVNLDAPSLFALAVPAGAFRALGAVFATTVTTGAGDLPFGVAKILGGVALCVGLILVIGAGQKLFTGNNLIVKAWAGGRASTTQLPCNLIYGFIYCRRSNPRSKGLTQATLIVVLL